MCDFFFIYVLILEFSFYVSGIFSLFFSVVSWYSCFVDDGILMIVFKWERVMRSY